MALHYTTGTELVPGFRLVKLLGRGGFGEVWKATAPGGTDAAIKIISLGERYGFKELRAIRLVKQVRHPNLAPIIAYWLLTADGKPLEEAAGDNTIVRRAQELYLVIAMGLGDKSLFDRLRECQREGKPGIPMDELLNHMEDAARAVDYLNQPIHDLGDGSGGIQHCDLKPQNILMVGGAAQVCDFGLARVLGDSRITSAKGSAAYMAPEMIADNKPSKSTDQYFLAISYIELRTGALPVDTSSPAKAIYAHMQGQLDLSKLPPAEQEILRKAVAVKPEDRYESCMEMVRALRNTTASAPSKTPSRVIKLERLLLPGSEAVPGYKLIRLLGKGGYGQVWEASAPGGKHVALKIIKNLEGAHGRQEFKALELIKGVDHNHLMELHAFWLLDRDCNVIPDEDRDRADAPAPSILVIASKLASKNLLQRLHECRKDNLEGIPIPELLGYMRQAADAIDYLNTPQHKLGDRKVSIQHRDIKPENILLSAGVVKVGDFGLAKVVEGTSAVIHGDSAGLTLAYAAPEMFTSVVTAWSDQYCLALTYFKLRTGGWPFPPDSKPNEIIKSHVLGKLDLSRLPAAEQPVIAHATAVKPEGRYPTCIALVEDLERAIRGTDVLPGTQRHAAPASQRGEAGATGAVSSGSSGLSSSTPHALAEPPAAPDDFRSLAPEEGSDSQFQETLSVPIDVGRADTTPPAVTPASIPPLSELEAQSTKTFNPAKAPGEEAKAAPTPPPASEQGPGSAPKTPDADVDELMQTNINVPRPPVDASARPSLPAGSGDATRDRAAPPRTKEGKRKPEPPPPERAPSQRVTQERPRQATHEVEPARDERTQSQPARPAGGGWRAGSSAQAPATGPTHGGGWGRSIAIVAVLGALIGGGLFAARQFIPALTDDTEAIASDARRLIQDRRYAEAVARLDSGHIRADVRKELQDSTRSGWVAQVRRELDDHDYARAAEDGSRLVTHFPDDAEAQRLNDQARVAAEVSDGIDHASDFPALSQKLAAARLDEAARRDLHDRLVKAWARDVRNDLLTRQDFDRAEKSAASLQRASDTPETGTLLRQATVARKVNDLLRQKRGFADAAQILSVDGADLDEGLRKSLQGKIALAWLEPARKALNDKDDEMAARLVRDVLDRYPAQSDALALRSTIRKKMLDRATQSLVAAEQRLVRNPDFRSEETARNLRNAEEWANKALDLFNGRDTGKEDPDGFYILGRIYELREEPVGAYAAYSAALPDPTRADINKLPVLLARVDFLTNPRWKKHLQELSAYKPNWFIRYADRAVALVTDNPSTDATLKARAYAQSARARILANDENAGSDEAKERREVAVVRLKLALEVYPRDPRPWRWRYDLARELKAEMVGAGPADRSKLRVEALRQLKQAADDAPPADAEKTVEPLRKQIQGMK